MKKTKEIKFRTVAVPNDVYKMIREIAEIEERTMRVWFVVQVFMEELGRPVSLWWATDKT